MVHSKAKDDKKGSAEGNPSGEAPTSFDFTAALAQIAKCKEEAEQAAREAKEAVEEMKKLKEETVKAKDEAEKAAAEAMEAVEGKGTKVITDGGCEGDKTIVYVGIASQGRQYAVGAYYGAGNKMNLSRKLDDICDHGMADIAGVRAVFGHLLKTDSKEKHFVIRADFSRMVDPKRKAADPEFSTEYDDLKKMAKKFANEVFFEHLNNPNEKNFVCAINQARTMLTSPSADSLSGDKKSSCKKSQLKKKNSHK